MPNGDNRINHTPWRTRWYALVTSAFFFFFFSRVYTSWTNYQISNATRYKSLIGRQTGTSFAGDKKPFERLTKIQSLSSHTKFANLIIIIIIFTIISCNRFVCRLISACVYNTYILRCASKIYEMKQDTTMTVRYTVQWTSTKITTTRESGHRSMAIRQISRVSACPSADQYAI